MSDSFKVKNKLNIKPNPSSGTQAGDLYVDSADSNKLKYYDGSTTVELSDSTADLVAHEADTSTHGVGEIVGRTETQTLTNKSIDADSNTITNIENADIKAAAAIDASKIADGSVSNAEFQRLDGVTGGIQSQINAKAPAASPTFSGTITTPLTASKALTTGASSELAASATTATELGYVSGVTSAIQTQINAKAPSASPTFSGTVTTPLTASRALTTGASSELAVSATTAVELGYVNGVTSAIQTQINAKAPTASPTFSGTITTPLTASRVLTTGASSELAASSITTTTLGYLDATSSIQTQLNTKAASSSPTLTTPTVDVVTHDDQASTPSNPSSGFYKTYFKSDGKYYYLDSSGTERQIGSGGGAGGKNYLSDLFDGTSVTGINRYADAAATSPVDGTGGSPNITAAAVNASSPLRGTANQRLSKDASNRQGEGWSYDFTVDRADYDGARPLLIKFKYKTSSNYASSDVRMFVYDKDGTTLLTVNDISNNSGNVLASSAGTSAFTGVFYPNSADNDYRLIFHITSTNASAWDFDVIDLSVGPDNSAPGAIVTEWVSYTPTGSWVSNTTYTGKWRRVGDTMDLDIKVAVSGAPTSASLTVNLPSGYTIDTNKITDTGQGIAGVLSTVAIRDAGTDNFEGMVRYDTTSSVAIFKDDGDGSVSAVTQAAPMTWANGDYTSIKITGLPIANWLASAALSSNEMMFSTVTVGASGNPASASSGNPIIFPTEDWDPFGAYDNSTGRFTAPRSGKYRVFGALTSASSATTLTIYVNAVSTTLAGNLDSNGEATFCATVKVVKGDLIDLRPGGTVDAATSSFFIEEVPDFSVFSAITPVITPWTAYTPTITHSSGGLTNGTTTGMWRRMGDSIQVRGLTVFSSTSAAFVDFYASIPSGITLDTTKLLTSTTERNLLGKAQALDTAAGYYTGFVQYRNTTTVRVMTTATASGTNPVAVGAVTITNAAPFTFNNTDTISWSFEAPISEWA